MTDETKAPELAEVETIPQATDKVAAAVEEARRALPLLSKLSPEIAQARKRLYDCHIEAGFTKEQALELCKQLTF